MLNTSAAKKIGVVGAKKKLRDGELNPDLARDKRPFWPLNYHGLDFMTFFKLHNFSWNLFLVTWFWQCLHCADTVQWRGFITWLSCYNGSISPTFIQYLLPGGKNWVADVVKMVVLYKVVKVDVSFALHSAMLPSQTERKWTVFYIEF